MGSRRESTSSFALTGSLACSVVLWLSGSGNLAPSRSLCNRTLRRSVLHDSLGDVGRKRTTDFDLPKRVYRKNGAFWYVTSQNKWIRLAPLDDYPGMLTALGELLTKGEPVNTVEILWAKYQTEVLPKLAKKTQTGRRNDMKQVLTVFGKVDPRIIEPHHVWTFWRDRGETEQARHEIKALSALLTFARQCGARSTDNPCFNLRLPGAKARDLYVTDEMFYAVHDGAPVMIKAAMELAWCGGMDEGTIRLLERRHVTANGLKFERGKTGKFQIIDGEDLVTIVRRILQERPQLRRSLICTRNGKAFTANGFQTAWQRAVRKAIQSGRLPEELRYHFHDIRAKGGSEAESDQAASDLLGHSDDGETARKFYRRLPQRSQAIKIFRPESV
jgi:hypothetical protein